MIRQFGDRIRRFLLLLLLAASLVISLGATGAAADAGQLVQQGVDRYQAGAYQAAIEDWRSALTLYQQRNDLANTALVLENLARASQQLGQTSEEIQYWQQAVELYRRLGYLSQQARMLTEQAQAHGRLGQARQAIGLLCGDADCTADSALALARAAGDRSTQAAALGSLGEAYRARRNDARAIEYLLQSQTIAREINNSAYLAAALNGLGNAHLGLAQTNYRRSTTATQAGNTTASAAFEQAGREQDIRALGYLQQSLTLAQQGDRSAQMRTLLNAIPAQYRTGADSSLPQALALLETLPDTQEKVYAAIDLAGLLEPTVGSAYRCFEQNKFEQQAALLQQAVAIAQRIGDRRSESFALGEWGHLYECQRSYQQALQMTQQARWAAEQLQAKDSLYLWEWQAGRIFKAQGRTERAIDAYKKAVATLEPIRSDLLTANRDLQFDFRDTVDPVYRGLVELLLVAGTPLERRENINAALKALDSLRLAELQNFFGNDCVIRAAPAAVNSIQADRATAVFSSVILDDRTAIIVSFPNGEQQIAWIDIDRSTLIGEVNDYRRGLERFYEPFNAQQAQKLYGWIVAPFAAALQQADVETLVFVQDGILRSVPMSALRDGDHYLVETYAIATTPSLTLTDAQPLDRRNLRALIMGLTQAAQIDGQTFPALNNVSREVAGIAAELPRSKPLLNQDFTRDRFQAELIRAAYPIVHMATHGQFATEPENTFLVTGDRQKLTLADLDMIFRNTPSDIAPQRWRDRPIELLFLTACQTAAGDDRAALGLAGVAVQAGVKSALASLWFIDDAATAQIATQFYAMLIGQNSIGDQRSKAQALQAAQLSIIQAGGIDAHPAFWAPFILIGNWL